MRKAEPAFQQINDRSREVDPRCFAFVRDIRNGEAPRDQVDGQVTYALGGRRYLGREGGREGGRVRRWICKSHSPFR